MMQKAYRHMLLPNARPAPSGSERVLYILNLLAQQGTPMTVAELAEASGLATSTLYRQLALLKSWGFVQESAASYMPGPACLQLALGFDQGSWLVREALPEMRRLSEKTNETIGLMVEAHEQMVCLEMVESRHSLRCAFVKGKGLPLFFGASAKSLLAFLPAARRASILLEAVENTTLSQAQHNELEREIIQIRSQGYASSRSEVDEGIWGVSVPLLPSKDKLLGTLTLMAPIFRAQSPSQMQGFIQQTRQCATRIITRLHGLA